MPELPEVETLRRELTRAVKGKTFGAVEVNVPKMTRPLSVPAFQKKLRGKKIIGVERRAKVLLIKLSDRHYLAIHLKMSGQLIYKPKTKNKKLVVGGHPQKGGLENLPNKFTHGIFHFTDGSTLHFNDLRKFGWLKLVTADDLPKIIGHLGVEALSTEFSLKKFQEMLKRYPNRKIKQLLVDQELIAGVGNIYADESCFIAKVKPMREAKSLKPAEIALLHRSIPKILKLAISHGGTSADLYVQLDGSKGGFMPFLKVYGRKGQKCKRCDGVIQKIKQNQRGTHFCPRCQR